MRPLSAGKSLAMRPFDDADGVVNQLEPELQTQANRGSKK